MAQNSPTISEAFIKEFDTDYKLAYQQMGTDLLNTVRQKRDVVGETARFQKIGVGIATKKDQHGDVVPMNPEHSYVDVTLDEDYAPVYVDKFDETKLNIDDRTAMVQTCAAALGRKTDEYILTVAKAGSAISGVAAGDSIKEKMQAIRAYFSKNRVPKSMRWVIVSPDDWNELLDIPEFSRSDFVGQDTLPWVTGATVKDWLGMMIMEHDQLDGENTICAYHSQAIGFAIARQGDVSTEMNYIPEKVSTLINCMMSTGSVAIDDVGIRTVPTNN